MRVPGYTQDVCGGPSKHGRYGYVDEEKGLAECDDCGIEFKVPRDQRKRDAELDAQVAAERAKRKCEHGQAEAHDYHVTPFDLYDGAIVVDLRGGRYCPGPLITEKTENE